MILDNPRTGEQQAAPQTHPATNSAPRQLMDGTGHVAVPLLAPIVFSLVLATDLWAGGTGTTMPWNTPMQTLLNNMTGPTARILVGIATAFAGYKWMFQSHEQGANSLARVTVGGAIALAAQTIISYASFGGALL